MPVRVFLLAFVVFAYFMPQWADWNIDSRLDLVHAIVDDHSLSIDRYDANTWDKALYRHHYYSDKAPGTAMLGVPVYAAFVAAHRVPLLGAGISTVEKNSAWNTAIALGKSDTQAAPAPKGRNLGGCQRFGIAHNVQVIPWGNRLVPPMRDWALSKYVVTVGVVGLLSALFAAFFFWFLGIFALGAITRWLTTGVLAVGSTALPYSSNFYSHQLSAAFLFTAFALLYLLHSARVRGWAAPVAGFLLGFALFTEYTVALIILVVGLYAIWILRRRPALLAATVAAGAIPVAGLAAYNIAVFGNPIDAGYSHDFCWSAAQAAGFQGFTYPHLGPLFDLTLGPFRGLFFASPFLLLAVPGLYWMLRRGHRAEALACGVIGVLFILALSAYWGWNGGRVDGPRYLVPVIPFLGFPAAFAVEAALRSSIARGLVYVLAGASLAVTWALFLGGDTFPMSWLRNPLVDWSLPALARNDVTSNAGNFLGLSGWQSLIPLALLVALIAVWPAGRVPQPAAQREPAVGALGNP
jgi:hypothetical protein